MNPGTAFCRHAATCGGCSLLHLSYAEQLARKTDALTALLDRVMCSTRAALPPPELVALFPADRLPSRFRQKVAFVFGADSRNRRPVMGHYARGSRIVVPILECPVHSDRGNRIAFALRDELVRAGIGAVGNARAGRAQAGVLRHVLVRTTLDDTEAVAMLVVTRNDKALRRPVRAFLQSPHAPDGFFININDDPKPFMVGPESVRISGQRHIRETINGTSYLVSPSAFFQTNAAAAAVLQRLIVDSADGATRLLDLYCGSGLFALGAAAASPAVRVVAVEENRQAISDAQANARLNRIDPARARFICARVEDAVTRLAGEPWDIVVMDPPRQGCPPAVTGAVFERVRPQRVLYVSCNPDALCAELPAMLRAGYRVDHVRVVDMFPHTDHIEAVLALSRC